MNSISLLVVEIFGTLAPLWLQSKPVCFILFRLLPTNLLLYTPHSVPPFFIPRWVLLSICRWTKLAGNNLCKWVKWLKVEPHIVPFIRHQTTDASSEDAFYFFFNFLHNFTMVNSASHQIPFNSRLIVSL